MLYRIDQAAFVLSGCFSLAFSLVYFMWQGAERFNSAMGNLAALCVSIYLGFVCLETTLTALTLNGVSTDLLSLKVEFLRLTGEYDRRVLFEFTEDYRRETGKKIYPLLVPVTYYPPSDQPLLPLGSIPNADMTVGKETGQYLCFKLDRFGFNNPDIIWDRKTLDFGVVGDSYAFGEGATEELQMVSIIRKQMPATLNVSLPAGDPVTEYASFTEFLLPLKPKTVLWFFAEANDLYGLTMRLTDFPLLAKYIREEGFTQHLRDKANEVEGLVVAEADRRYSVGLENYKTQKSRQVSFLFQLSREATNIFKLVSLRHMVAFARDNFFNELYVQQKDTYSEEDFVLAVDIISHSSRMVSGWGGRMILVYIPEGGSYFPKIHRPFPSACVKDRDRLLARLGEQGVEIINLDKVFRAAGEPLQFYQKYVLGGHLNDKGQALAVKVIQERMKAVN